MEGCSVDQLCTQSHREAYGAMSIEPKKMAALAPAIVMVNGLRKIESCFDICDLTRAEGMNREPTAGS
jgi:hypothetical protein